MKKNKLGKIIFILIGVVLVSLLIFKLITDIRGSEPENKKISSIELYGYTLSKSDTKLYKDNFKELESILNKDSIDYTEYAKSISKLFVIDVFTLNNKLSSTDIGGLEFVHKDLKENFKENLGATLYKNIEINLDGKRTQDLMKVSSVTVDNVFETVYKYNEKDYKAYLVTLSWEYTKSNDYQKSIKLTIINDNDKLYVVKGE